MHTSTSTNPIHLHTGQSPIDIQSNTCKCSGKHESRATQAKPIAVQPHNCSISGKCMTSYCSRKPQTTAADGEQNTHAPPTSFSFHTNPPSLSSREHPMGRRFPGAPKSSRLTNAQPRHGQHPTPGDERHLTERPGPR